MYVRCAPPLDNAVGLLAKKCVLGRRHVWRLTPARRLAPALAVDRGSLPVHHAAIGTAITRRARGHRHPGEPRISELIGHRAATSAPGRGTQLADRITRFDAISPIVLADTIDRDQSPGVALGPKPAASSLPGRRAAPMMARAIT